MAIAGSTHRPEDIYNFKHNNHHISPGGAWFHANHINLRIGVVHIMAGESSEILCRWLAKALLSQWVERGDLDGVWYNNLRTIPRKAFSFVSLQQVF